MSLSLQAKFLEKRKTSMRFRAIKNLSRDKNVCSYDYSFISINEENGMTRTKADFPCKN